MDYINNTVGKFLISSPRMDDDIFRKTVVLILGHDSHGAMGVIVNRTASFNLEDLCKGLDIPIPENLPKRQVHFGGPVSMSTGIVVHSRSYQTDGTVAITDRYLITPCTDVLRDIQKGSGPRDSLFVLGNCAWGPGQLEEELRHGDWILSESSEDIVFGYGRSFLWDRALKYSDVGRFSHIPIVGTA